ncbi:MAG: mechanosensitive ion channel [Hyphomonadaceae bacterium]
MEQFIENITDQATYYAPKLIAATIIIVITIIVATLVRTLIAKGIDATGLAKKANNTVEPGAKTLGFNLGTAAYWVIILIGMIQALTKLDMTTIVDPLNDMLSQILAYLPKIIAAVIVFGVFMIVANVVRQAIKSVLIFADPMPAKFGLATDNVNVSGITATVASAMIAIFGGIAALEVLDISAISDPAIGLLDDIVGVIPNILVAGIILGLFVFIAKFVSGLARKTLPNFGIDAAVAELGVLKGADSGMTASGLIASASSFFIILLGLIQSLKVLNFDALTNALNIVLEMGGQIAFGAVIIFAGVFLARMITGVMASAGSGATDVAAGLVKWVIIILSVILGISRMGLDPTGGEFILNVAEYFIMGGAAAAAIAFGWGGKDWAAAQLEKLRSSK